MNHPHVPWKVFSRAKENPLSSGAEALTFPGELAAPESIPANLAPVLLAALQREAPPAYAITPQGDLFQADSAGLHTVFSPDRIQVTTPTLQDAWGLELRGWGYGAPTLPIPAPERVVEGNRAEYR